MCFKLYYRNQSGDRGLKILSSRAACWEALLYSNQSKSQLVQRVDTEGQYSRWNVEIIAKEILATKCFLTPRRSLSCILPHEDSKGGKEACLA